MTTIANDTLSTNTPTSRGSPKRVPQVRKTTAVAAMPTKVAQAAKLLARARGATMTELGTATGWQPHSVRAMLSGLRKKGVRLVKETRKSGDSCYRIEGAGAAADADTAAPPPTAECPGALATVAVAAAEGQ
ncbi:hypothetical protein GCM10007973_32530 [Polymorphobacter multimanifer]|nr:hypothetical protein GCM10007973_32530 [Polymorphobacter multimanifer]